MKIIAGINAFVIAASASAALADPGALPQRSDALAAHRVGQILDYSLQGNMAQSIDGKDAFGRAIHQNAMPTTINGRERIAFKRLSASSMFISRSGSLTATVAGKSRPIRGVGHTVVDPSGTITRDRGTIGGVFLLPLAFLGQRSMHAGADLVVGDSWSGQLGTKLFGMTARPRLRYTVTGRRSVLRVQVFTISASGQTKMKEPVSTDAGVAVGNAVGSATVSMSIDYDRDNQRVVSMDLRLSDALHYAIAPGHHGGVVRDRQQYLVALDASSMLNAAPSAADAGSQR